MQVISIHGDGVNCEPFHIPASLLFLCFFKDEEDWRETYKTQLLTSRTNGLTWYYCCHGDQREVLKDMGVERD